MRRKVNAGLQQVVEQLLVDLLCFRRAADAALLDIGRADARVLDEAARSAMVVDYRRASDTSHNFTRNVLA